MNLLSKLKKALRIGNKSKSDLFQFTSTGLNNRTRKELLKSPWLQEELNKYIASEEYSSFLIQVYSTKPKLSQVEIYRMMGEKLTPKYIELREVEKQFTQEMSQMNQMQND